jgi:cAMP-dependent protein kinase regulator
MYIHRIRARLLQSFMFNTLDQASFEIVINAMDFRCFKRDDTVISQGDSGHELYVVEEGLLACFKQFVINHSHLLIDNRVVRKIHDT